LQPTRQKKAAEDPVPEESDRVRNREREEKPSTVAGRLE
jgi:hypothetical protein